MKTFAALSCGLILSLALTGASLAKDAAGIPVQLTPLNNSGETATAIFEQVEDGVKVSVKTKNGLAEAQPMHIHTGNCDNQPAVKWKLESVVDGSSVTMLKGAKLSELNAGDYTINIHKSTKDMGTYVSCANLKGALHS
jgi:CHRD domain